MKFQSNTYIQIPKYPFNISFRFDIFIVDPVPGKRKGVAVG